MSTDNVYMDVGQIFACDMRNTVHLTRRLVKDWLLLTWLRQFPCRSSTLEAEILYQA